MKRVVFLCTDLLFSSRVRSAAVELGTELQLVANPQTLIDQAGDAATDLVLIDLAAHSSDLAETVQALSKLNPAPTVIAYASHVLEERIQYAQDAGCDVVLTRGQFDQQFRDLLRSDGQ